MAASSAEPDPVEAGYAALACGEWRLAREARLAVNGGSTAGRRRPASGGTRDAAVRVTVPESRRRARPAARTGVESGAGAGNTATVSIARAARTALGDLMHALRGRDLPLHAAGVTFYGGIAVVPAAVLSIRLAGLIAGGDQIERLTVGPIGAVPDVLGAERVTRALITAGLELGWAETVAALVPATLYGEGLRRAFSSLGTPRGPVRGWRGRLLVLPLLAAGPGLLLGLLLVLPTAAGLLSRGGWAGVGGVVVSFLVVWAVLSTMLTWVYRVVGPHRPRWPAAAVAGTLTAANVSGFAHGFVLFWAIPLDLGLPFGGFATVGATVAVALWLYLLHALALVGYVAALTLDRRPLRLRR